MKIIVPMAGRGSRLRPHTLTVPKPLIPVAGKPIVHRLVSDIAKVLGEPIEEIAFILGPAVIAYADTLIRADFNLDKNADSVIWTKKVNNPEAYGVVNLNEDNHIIELVEKPDTFVSDQAVIGIYYFKDVNVLRNELQYVLDNNIINGGEYQINDGIKRMMANGKVFVTGKVDEWMDCGNKNVTVETNQRMLGFLQNDGESLLSGSIQNENSTIIEPCFIGDNVVLKNSQVGPHVSIGNGTIIENSTIKNTIIQNESQIKNATLNDAMIGNFVKYDGDFKTISIGDFSVLE